MNNVVNPLTLIIFKNEFSAQQPTFNKNSLIFHQSKVIKCFEAKNFFPKTTSCTQWTFYSLILWKAFITILYFTTKTKKILNLLSRLWSQLKSISDVWVKVELIAYFSKFIYKGRKSTKTWSHQHTWESSFASNVSSMFFSFSVPIQHSLCAVQFCYCWKFQLSEKN